MDKVGIPEYLQKPDMHVANLIDSNHISEEGVCQQ